MSLKRSVAYGALLVGASLAMANPVAAQTTAQISNQIDALQQQIQQLQQQLRSVQSQVDAQKAAAPAAAAPGAPLVPAVAPNGGIQLGGVNLKFGGFTEAAGIFRTRNEVADVGTDFNGIPFANNPRSHETELRASARQSRISGLITGDVSKDTHLAAYAESDFLGASDVSNSRESNSYLLRVRHFYGTVDEDAWGFHFLAGQTWSLLTTNTQGIMPRREQIPLTIDAQYVPGFNWTRNPQARVVGNFGNVWVGLSVESPQALVGGNTPAGAGTVTNGTNPNAINGGDGTGLLSANQTFSTDTWPDLVAKLAIDTGFGHYELKGIGRAFTDRFQGANHTTIGGGLGAAAVIPVVPKLLDVQASTLIGYGVGRYGSGQINDVSFATNGGFIATPEIEALVGAVAHATSSTDLYLYAGFEQVDRTSTSTGVGFGSPLAANGPCLTEVTTGLNGAAPACPAITHRIAQITGGVWQDLYKGNFGRIAVGAQGSYTKKYTFSGVGGVAPNVNEAVVMTSFRYYPF